MKTTLKTKNGYVGGYLIALKNQLLGWIFILYNYKMNELKEKIKKLELELEDVKSARDCLVRYSQGLYNKILELEDELDKKNEIIAKIQSIITK